LCLENEYRKEGMTRSGIKWESDATVVVRERENGIKLKRKQRMSL